MPDSDWRLDKLPVHGGPPLEKVERRVRVHELVIPPLDLDQADLSRFAQITIADDSACEEGWLVPEQTPRGVLVGELPDAARRSS